MTAGLTLTKRTAGRVKDLATRRQEGGGPPGGGAPRVLVNNVDYLYITDDNSDDTYDATLQRYNATDEAWESFSDAGAITVIEANGAPLSEGARYAGVQYGDDLYVVWSRPIVKIIDLDTATYSVGSPLQIDDADVVILTSSTLTSGDSVTIEGIANGHSGRQLKVLYAGPGLGGSPDEDDLHFITFSVFGGTNRNRIELGAGSTWRLRSGFTVDLSYADGVVAGDGITGFWQLHTYYMPWWFPYGTTLPVDGDGRTLAGGLEAEYALPRIPANFEDGLPFLDENAELDLVPSTISDDGNGAAMRGTLRFSHGTMPLTDDESFPHAAVTFMPGGGANTADYLGRRQVVGTNTYATWLYNPIGNGDWTLTHDYATPPTDHYAFHCPDAADFVLAEGEGVLAVFDADADRWCIVGQKVIDSISDLGGTPATSSSPVFSSYGG